MPENNNTLKRAEFNSKFGLLSVFAQIKNIYFVHSMDGYSRTAEEQNKLFRAGLSKCDGYEKVSMHQLDRARDIYIIDEKGSLLKNLDNSYPVELYETLGKFWKSLGGIWQPIAGDIFHFEL